MAETIFRQAALDRLASPERLDAPLTLVGAPRWMLLGAIAAAIVGALGWAIVTQAPVRVAGGGILIDRAGLVEVVASETGQLQSLAVAPGDRVVAGQALATLARGDLRREQREATDALAGARERLIRLRGFYGEQAGSAGADDRERAATIAETQRALRERLAFLNQRVDSNRQLVARGVVLRDALAQTQEQVAEVRERLGRLAEEATAIRTGATRRSGEAGLALLDAQAAVDEKQRAVAMVSARLGEQQTIRATRAGRVVEIKVASGDVVIAGTPLATLMPEDGTLTGLLYLPAAAGKRVTVGMPAEIAPATVERAEYGDIRGVVSSVAPLPATAAGMRKVLRNDQLVDQLLAGGAPIEVRVTLTRDRGTRTGYAWSGSRGPARALTPGTPVQGRVVVDRRRVISWLVPLRRDDGAR